MQPDAQQLLSRVGWSAVGTPISFLHLHALARPNPTEAFELDDPQILEVIAELCKADYLTMTDDQTPPLFERALLLTPEGAAAAAQLPRQRQEEGRQVVEEHMSSWMDGLETMETHNPGFAAHLLPHLERLVNEAERANRMRVGLGMGLYFERAAEMARTDPAARHTMRRRAALCAERLANTETLHHPSTILNVVTSALFDFVQYDLQLGALPTTHRERLELILSLQPDHIGALTYLAVALLPAVERIPLNLPPGTYRLWREASRADYNQATISQAEALLTRAEQLEQRQHGGRAENLSAIHERFAQFWSIKGDYARARAALQKSRLMQAQHGNTAILPLLDASIAITFLEEGDADNALRQMQAALRLAQREELVSPQFALTLSNAAGLLRMHGRNADAKQLLQRSLALAARPGVDPSIHTLIAENIALMDA